MNETLNNTQYLFLKQQLVVFEASSLKAVVTVGQSNLAHEDLGKSIRETINGIDVNMTIPVALMERRETNVNFRELCASIGKHLCAIEEERFSETSYEMLGELINKFPKTNQVISLSEEDDKRYGSDRSDIGKMLDIIARLIGTINNWTTFRQNGSGCPVRDILICVNFLQMLDELFEYTNEKFGA